GVHLLGMVSREDLCQLYAAADALVVASYAEGFCLPVLEAHVCGTPVIARPVPAVLELLSASDTVCTDFSLNALQDALVDFSGRAHSGLTLSEAEISGQLECFSAVNTAARVLEVYREALGLKGRGH
ncbi:MAG: glycosyltransferase, partial [Prosthecobacter sp.]|nr:glycosyltransferase [Prosthecobacter sp.]